MEEIVKFLKEAETYYLATVEGDQPRVRPFGTAHIFEGKLYIQTGKKKDVSKQLHPNPKADVRIAAGRNYFKDGGGELFLSGINAALTGNLLTTGGSSMEQDRNILEEKGYILKKKPTEK